MYLIYIYILYNIAYRNLHIMYSRFNLVEDLDAIVLQDYKINRRMMSDG